MKKILYIYLAAVFMISSYSDQQRLACAQADSSGDEHLSYFVGTVVARSKSGTRITVLNSKGEKMTFSIRSKTVITALRFNKGRTKITAADIRLGTKVSVRINSDPRAEERISAVVIIE